MEIKERILRESLSNLCVVMLDVSSNPSIVWVYEKRWKGMGGYSDDILLINLFYMKSNTISRLSSTFIHELSHWADNSKLIDSIEGREFLRGVVSV